jgi:alpha-L-arabinofuranosidase
VREVGEGVLPALGKLPGIGPDRQAPTIFHMPMKPMIPFLPSRFLPGWPQMGRRIASAACVVLIGSPISAREYHVSPGGADTDPGTAERPFRSISAAARIAHSGDVIYVHAGVYRERVNPPRGGASDRERIIYQAAPGERVVLKGSELVKGWRKRKHDTWEVTLPNDFFGDYNPYADVIGGEWYATPKDGFDRHTGAVYLNGAWLDEAREMEDVLAPAGGLPLWKAEVGAEDTTIRAQFPGLDPNEETVEINVRQSVFYPDQPGRNFITVRGFTMQQAATPWSGAMSEQVGLLGTHWSKGWIIEDNEISHSMNTGITLGRYDLGRHGIAMPPATAPGFVRSCELALRHGWSKDNIGSHVVRNNRISHCEKNGIHGSLGGIFSTIEGNTIHDIAVRGWIRGPDVAGLKLLASHDVLIRNNHIHRCSGVGGIWLDWMAQGTRVTSNLLHDNTQDLFMEVNHGPFLVDHNLFLSGNLLRDWSQGGAYAHNLINGTIEARTETRETPFFTPHSVEDMRLAAIRKTDFRFHNNLFAGGNGTAAFNTWAANLQAAGNVYLAGSNPCAGEGGAVVKPDFNPGLTLTRSPAGEWWLEMAVNPAWLSAQTRRTVTTALLGTAVVPSQAFEQPDGTPYLLDTDYSGAPRNAANPAPGPFEFTSGPTIRRKVWPRPTAPGGASSIQLLAPADRSVTYATPHGDEPRLAWRDPTRDPSKVLHYEVWLDGERVDQVPAGAFGAFPGGGDGDHDPLRPYGWLPDERLTYYTPALAHLPEGPHRWQIKAVDKDGQKRSSDGPSHFTIEAPKADTTVFVNHLGYLSDESKQVVADAAAGGSDFEVLDPAGRIVFSGVLQRGTGTFGDHLCGDFSGLREPGSYRIRVGAEHSLWFPVGPEARLNYEVFLRKFRHAYRRKRCGDTTVNLSGKPCHLEDARIAGGARHGIVGGWHASSDVRKIMRILQPGLEGLLDLKRIADPPWDTGTESILDEIKWGNRYIHAMQLGSGALAQHQFLWCGATDWGESLNRYTNNQPGDADDRVLPEESLVIDMVSQSRFIKNQTTIHRLYRDIDPEYARLCLEAATRCYDYFHKTWPVVTDYETTFCARPFMEPVTDLMPLAYGVRANLSMHLATGEPEYRQRAVDLADKIMALQEARHIADQDEVRGFFYRDSEHKRDL